jgi:hypothetical protein
LTGNSLEIYLPNYNGNIMMAMRNGKGMVTKINIRQPASKRLDVKDEGSTIIESNNKCNS